MHSLVRLIFVLLVSSNIALANSQDPVIINEVKSYLGSIKSIAVGFEQLDSFGAKASGMLLIEKPYKFRCNYYPPFPLLIVGNKNYVSVYDYEMESLSRIDAKDNIFYFLLVDSVKFDAQFKVLSTLHNEGEYIIKLMHLELAKESEITFDKLSKRIKLIKINEGNNVILVKFTKYYDHRIPLDNKLFFIQDPAISGKPARLSENILVKNILKQK